MFRHAGYVVDALGDHFENATTQDFAFYALAITFIAWFCTKYYAADP